MANLDGAIIRRGTIGANALINSDAISGMIVGAVATSEFPLDSTKIIHNTLEAEALGITAEYDTDNNLHFYRHITEFYRIAGEGTKLYLHMAAQNTTLVAMCESANESLAKAMIIEGAGEIKQLTMAVNPTGVTTLLNGVPDDVFNAIAKAQELYDWADANFMPCQIVLEGYDYGGTSLAAQNLRAIENVSAPKVSVVIGQDYNYAETKGGNAQKFADVGTALGTIAAAAVNQNIGDNESFNLTDATKKKWLVAGLSNHQTIKSQLSQLQTLEDKGYIFGTVYPPMAGVRWNNDHTCVEVVVDEDGNINEHTIAYGRVHDKARRLLRAALLPKVKTPQPVTQEGKLPIGVVKYFENIGDGVFDDMINAREISEGKTVVDPASDLLVEKLLKTRFKIVPYGSVNTIEGISNLKNSL